MRIRYKLVKELREAEVPGVEVVNPAGHGKQSWVLIAIGDVAIHWFTDELREDFKIEEILTNQLTPEDHEQALLNWFRSNRYRTNKRVKI